MITVQFPEPQFKIKKEREKHYVFDGIRKTWLLLTDEEWVRQNFVAYLTQTLHYPASLVALEKEIFFNELKKRFDVLVYDKDHHPWMLVECKAPHITLSEDVLGQALRYNVSMPVKFIVITNGGETIGWQKEESKLTLLEQLPLWPFARN